MQETTLRMQRNSRVILGILVKGRPHENFLENSNFRNGWKWHILCKFRCQSRCCNRKLVATLLCWNIVSSLSKNGRHNAPEKPVGKNLEMAESGIFCGKSDADHDAAVENCLRYFSAEILTLRCPKSGLQNSPKKPVGNALFGKPLRANGYCDVIEIHLK